ncbi:hypothetical protein HY640_05225 [Candidatus Woesearchaeota archaeon]|nr:hypothetical protein [Candidatus Woesearchaeota archaeon]
MRIQVTFVALAVLALLLLAGCTENKTTGYSTYSGNSQPASGGGGCGRFDSAGTWFDVPADTKATADSF